MTDREALLRAALLEAIATAEQGGRLLAFSEHGRNLKTLAAKWRAVLDQVDQA